MMDLTKVIERAENLLQCFAFTKEEQQPIKDLISTAQAVEEYKHEVNELRMMVKEQNKELDELDAKIEGAKMPEKKLRLGKEQLTKEGIDFYVGYNTALDEVRPLVARLTKEKEELEEKISKWVIKHAILQSELEVKDKRIGELEESVRSLGDSLCGID
jgi:DNA repair exonuclease SbcCD ATPase subunit